MATIWNCVGSVLNLPSLAHMYPIFMSRLKGIVIIICIRLLSRKMHRHDTNSMVPIPVTKFSTEAMAESGGVPQAMARKVELRLRVRSER